MKTLTTRLTSIVLVLAMVLSMSSSVFAAEYYSTDEITLGTNIGDDIQMARDAYYALSPEAKEIFDATLADTPELLEFHKNYIDKDFIAPVQSRPQAAAASKTDPMTVLMAELTALALPTAVLYSLKAVGAGMIASIADGPLPVGEILLAAAAVSAAATLALNWEQVSPKWNKIVKAFQKAFADSAANVLKAFNKIKEDVLEIISAEEVKVTVSGKTITVGDEKFRCNTKAEELTAEQQKNKKYFPAVLYRGVLYVDPFHDISNNTAKAILAFNSSFAGVWAMSEKYARGVAGSNAVWHNMHDNKEGYFYHYHPSYASSAHCWYPS